MELRERLYPARTRVAREDEHEDAAPAPQRVPGKLTRIDRRAEGNSELPDGAAATAFEYLENASAGQSLPSAVAADLGASLGIDLKNVRIHTDERAAKAAATLGARAFTIGEDIYFASGAYDPHSEAGLRLIAHEVTHVAQQYRGTAPANAGVSRPDDHHERQADAFADSFTTRRSSGGRSQDDGLKAQIDALEQSLGTQIKGVRRVSGDAAVAARKWMRMAAFAARDIVSFADPSPQRTHLLDELEQIASPRSALGTFESQPTSVRSGTGIHRGKSDQATSSSVSTAVGDILQRWKDFLNTEAGTPLDLTGAGASGVKKQAAFGKRHGRGFIRYKQTSKKPILLDAYAVALGLDKEQVANDLKRLYAEKQSEAKIFKVASPSSENADDGRRWAYVADPDVSGLVVYLEDQHRKVNDDASFRKVAEGVLALQHVTEDGGPFLVNFKSVTLDDKVVVDLDPDRDREYTPEEAEAVREGVRKALSEDDKFAWSETAHWSVFLKQVSKKARFEQAIQGAAFGLRVQNDLEKAGFTLKAKEVVIYDKHFQTGELKRRGDGYSTQGATTIVEFKSGAGKAPKEGEDDYKQAQDYYYIVSGIDHTGKNRGKPKEIRTAECAEMEFTEVAYIFTTPQIAKDWAPVLAKAFRGDTSKLKIFPPVDGFASIPLKTNPTFMVPLTDKNASTHVIADPFFHAGIKVSKATIHTAGPGSTEVKSGTLEIETQLAPSMKGEKEIKQIKPAAEGGGTFDGTLTNIKTGLEKIFKRVEPSVRITDNGVEGEITITPGASGIPQVNISKGSVKVTYGNDGNLAATGEVELAHAKGSLTAKVGVTWADGDWTVSGEVTLNEGLVEGLSAVTGTATYDKGNWKFGIKQAGYTRKFGAITLTGNAYGLEYDVTTGGFSGALELEADLGMFGTASASAELKDNKLHKATLDYDSPTFTYPAKSEKPAFKGTVGGTLKYNEGKFSGDIRGTANIVMPALQKIAGEKGIGLAVDGHIDESGGFNGTIKSTNPLKFGKYLEIPKLSCAIAKDGSVTGDFAIKVINIKGLEEAEVACSVTKDGITVKKAAAKYKFGNEEKGQFWGELSVGYEEEKGLEIGGTVNYKIKDDMIAVGTLTYDQKTNAVTLEMKVKEITLLDKTISKTLFTASKQIPVVNVYGLGIYVDIGFDLGFDFGFKLTMTPEVDFVGLSLDTWKFDKIAAKLVIGGDVFAQLTGTPKLGLGVFALDPSIIRGGGGLKVPIVGRLDIKPSGNFGVDYKPDGGVTGTAKLGLAGQFGITGSLKPYAEFSVLNDMWNPKWTGEALTSFEILKPTELFNFTVDFAGDNKDLKDGPPLPEKNQTQAPREPTGDKTAKATEGKQEEKGADANKDQPAKSGAVTESGDQGPFSLEGLLEKFKGNKTVATAEKIFDWARKVWKVVKPFYDIIEPIVKLIGERIEAIIDLFETEAPTADNIVPWLWKLAQKLWNVGFGGITDLAKAILTIAKKAADFAAKFITKCVEQGQIGVRRHSYYIWMPWPKDDIQFMAAAEWKINIPGVAALGQHGPPGFLLEPSGAVGLVLYEALEYVGLGFTNTSKSDINEPYNDIWYPAGERP